MLSNPQKALIKQAQRQAGLGDAEYREVLETVSGCRSTTDPRLSDRHCDKILAYMEAIYWRKVDQGHLGHAPNPRAAFRERRYWAAKNTAMENSRDRFMQTDASKEIERLEAALQEIGYGSDYLSSIRQKTTKGEDDAYSLNCYAAALKRTLKAKQKQREDMNPF